MSDSKVEKIEEIINNAFRGVGGKKPPEFTVEKTPYGNVKVIYNIDANKEEISEQVDRYYIGNMLRAKLESVTVTHDTTGDKLSTFVRW